MTAVAQFCCIRAAQYRGGQTRRAGPEDSHGSRVHRPLKSHIGRNLVMRRSAWRATHPVAQPRSDRATDQIERKHDQAKVEPITRTAGNDARERRRRPAPRPAAASHARRRLRDALAAMNHRDPAHRQARAAAQPAASPNEIRQKCHRYYLHHEIRCGGFAPCLRRCRWRRPAGCCRSRPRVKRAAGRPAFTR